MDRQDFLANIRRSLSTAQLPEAGQSTPTQPELSAFEPEALVEPFTLEATKLSAVVHRVADANEAFGTILEIFDSYQAQCFLAWDDAHLPLDNLGARLADQQLTRLDGQIEAPAPARRESLARASEADIGLTGALGGLADTGTIVLQSGSGRGRLASLLPPVHIALLKIADLCPTMAHFLAAQSRAVAGASNLVFISGPSRTADIEQTLTLGVHGPGKLHVILL